MKRLGGLWPKIVSFDNLLLAFRKAPLVFSDHGVAGSARDSFKN